VLVLLVASLAQTAGARGQAESPKPSSVQEVDVVAVVQDARSRQPVVLLAGKRDKRPLMLAIGPAEATSIAVPLEGLVTPRPLTHDLFLTLFGHLKASLARVVITDLRDGIFYASIEIKAGERSILLDSRPSDAIALAIRAKVPVLVATHVFDKSEQDKPGAPRQQL
jgi:bifunctional DNase/RNase